MASRADRQRVLDDKALLVAQRVLWAACVAVYVMVFVGSLLAGVADLTAVGRAVAFTLATALLGKLAIVLMSRASQPLDKGPTADEDGTVGSLIDLTSSPNVATPEREAGMA